MEILIGRDQEAVTVTCRGDRSQRSLRQLRHVLGDLVDGQGNLTIQLEFPDIAVVDLAVVDLVVEVAGRVSSRGGRLSVVSMAGRWDSTQSEAAGAR